MSISLYVRAGTCYPKRSATICRVDADWQPVGGTERTIDVDTICLSVGLTPNCELASMAGCRDEYVPEALDLDQWVQGCLTPEPLRSGPSQVPSAR